MGVSQRSNSPQPLPIDDVLPDLVDSLRRSNCVVLRAPPGAGKTTRVPPSIVDSGLASDKQVVVLQPRRLAARAAAWRVAEERGSAVGDEVGYQVRFEKRAGPRTRILYVTDGIFLRLLQEDPFLERLASVVFDEFHERNLNSDLALAMVRRVQREVRPELKIVVMSATLMTEPVARYLGECPVLVSEGRLHPVAVQYLNFTTPGAIASKVVPAVSDAIVSSNGHVLVFLPGVGEIRQVGRELAPLAERTGVAVQELYGDMPLDRQQEVLRKSGERKVILATNVAETSVTIEGVTAVVDSGLARVARIDASTGINRLEIERVSRASAEQRTGRAGRTAPGICYRLWTEREQVALAEFDQPEVARVDLAGAVLELYAWGETDVRSFPWFEAPPAESIEQAVSLLRRLGAIDERGITAEGRSMARLPVHPRVAKLVLEGRRMGVSERVAWIAAMLSERDRFRVGGAGGARKASHRSDSDVLDRLIAVEGSLRSSPLGVGIDRNALRSLMRAQRQLLRLVDHNIDCGVDSRTDAVNDDEAVLRAILAAYPDRLARRREAGSNRAVLVGGRGVRLAEESAVTEADLFVCVEWQEIGKSEALVRQASAVERAWLPAQLTKRGVEVEFDRERGRLVAYQRTRFEDLVIDEAVTAVPRDFDGAQVLATAAVERWPNGEWLDDASRTYLARLDTLREAMPELQLPELGVAGLAGILHQACQDYTSLDEVRSADFIRLIRERLEPRQSRIVEREAPERIEVPSGSLIKVEYERGRPPVLAVRIQELFGLQETPRIAGGRVRVVLHLLGPNYRPQQITRDLASFWKNTYPEVRKELRRRYPKHSWPEDPLTARAERRPGGRRA
jgi:ATP-dependent helicase HrpB